MLYTFVLDSTTVMMRLLERVFSWCDRHMILSKIGFFLTYGSIGSLMPFINVYFVSIGLSSREAGFITGYLCPYFSSRQELYKWVGGVLGEVGDQDSVCEVCVLFVCLCLACDALCLIMYQMSGALIALQLLLVSVSFHIKIKLQYCQS